MADVRIVAGTFAFRARFERAAAPLTCARFARMLPYRERLIHVRWSGDACWIPLGGLDLGLGYENTTSYLAPGMKHINQGILVLGCLLCSMLGTGTAVAQKSWRACSLLNFAHSCQPTFIAPVRHRVQSTG